MYMTCMTMHHPHQPSHIGAGPVLAPPDSWARAAIRGERRYPKRMFCRVGGEPIFLRRVLHVCTERALPYGFIHAAYLYKDTLWPLHATLQHTHTQLRTHRGSTCRLVQKATFWSPAPLYAPRLFWLLLSSAGFAVLCSPRPLNSARSAALCATQGTWPAVVELCRRWREPSSALLVASLCRG